MNVDTALEILRFVLGAGLVVANVAVWYGVWLERDSSPPEVQHRGWRILVRGLAAETTVGFLLFAIDTSIGARQQNEIAAAETRAANAVLEAGRLGVKVDKLPAFVDQKEREIGGQFAKIKTYADAQQKQNDIAASSLRASTEKLSVARDQALAAAASAQNNARTLLALREPRHLLVDRFIAAVRGVPKFVLVIKAGTTEGDERTYGDEIAAALRPMGWKVHVDNAIHMGADTSGLWIVVRGTGGEAAPVPVVAFRDALAKASMAIRNTIVGDPNVPAMEVWLCIGKKE